MLHVEDQLPGSNHRVRGAMQGGKSVDQRDRGRSFRSGHSGGMRSR